MAKMMLQGEVADIRLDFDDEDGGIIATCVLHGAESRCPWSARYDDLRDAVEYAENHADTGRE